MRHEVFLTDHAIRRYVERVRPGLPRSVAARELVYLLRAVAVMAEYPPSWVNPNPDAPPADEWLLIGDDVALPVVDRAIMTVLTKGGMSPKARASRNAEAAKRRKRRRQRRTFDVPASFWRG